MSGITSNGCVDRCVNLCYADYNLSISVDDGQLNKMVKSISNSGLIIKYHFNCDLKKGDKKPKSNQEKYPTKHTVLSEKRMKNSGSESKNELSPDDNKLSHKKIKILIAEDDEVSSQFLTIVLKDISREFIWTRTGRETLKQCKNNKDIDLILMDIKMPDPDGLETTKKIREFNKDVYIIAQTARALEGDREEALFAGCNDYITKPIDRIVLLEKINKLFFSGF